MTTRFARTLRRSQVFCLTLTLSLVVATEASLGARGQGGGGLGNGQEPGGGGGSGSISGPTPPPIVPPMTRFLDAYPESLLTAMATDDVGNWLFSAEGGKLAIVDLHGIDDSTPANPDPFDDPLRVHRVDIGPWGVRPAALLLDPEGDLDKDSGDDDNASNDREDLLYVAGGVMGLWVLEARTSMAIPDDNDIVRVDDSWNGIQTQVNGFHHCNQLETITVGGVDYLIATFARKGKSTLRFYRLSRLRDLAEAGAPNPDGTGAEIAPDHIVPLPARPGFSQPGSATSSFPTGIAVDQAASPVRIFVSMRTHGVVRVTPVGNATGIVYSDVEWGPMMGDGSPAAANEPVGFAGIYHNLDYRIMSRAVEFGDIERSEPPVYTDVAVQNDTIGHFLYCTVDHLNWVRYDLSGAWASTLAIEHHEGEPVSIPGQVGWRTDDGYPALAPPFTYGPDDWTVRAADFPPEDNSLPLGPEKKDATFAVRCELVDAPNGSVCLVVTSSLGPFLGSNDVI